MNLTLEQLATLQQLSDSPVGQLTPSQDWSADQLQAWLTSQNATNILLTQCDAHQQLTAQVTAAAVREAQRS